MQARKHKKLIGWLLLGSLLVVAACAGGEVSTYRPTSYPVYNNQYYYPDLRSQPDDPQFWPMWMDRQGGG
jgi:hypothetical protein